MSSDDPDVVTLWRPTGQAEWDLVVAGGHRTWPPRLREQPIFYPVLSEWYATTIARQWNVRDGGTGYVTAFDVRSDWLAELDVQQTGGREVLEYWIPADRLTELNLHIVGAIREVARYIRAAPVEEVEALDRWARLRGGPLPAAWAEHLRSPSRLEAGRLPSGAYLSLHGPDDSRVLTEVWTEGRDAHPGVLLLGTDGAAERLAVDLRDADGPVWSLPNVSAGWADQVWQAGSVADLVARVEAGTFVLNAGSR